MNLLLDQLKADHRQMVTLLYHLGAEVKAICGMSRRRPDLDRILEVIDYIQTYPQVWHHPVEDCIYAEIMDHGVSIDHPDYRLVLQLHHDHETLEILTEYLHELYSKKIVGEPIPAARLVKTTEDYIRRQLQHIELEQLKVWPLIDQYVDQQGWDRIRENVNAQTGREGDLVAGFRHQYHSIQASSMYTA